MDLVAVLLAAGGGSRFHGDGHKLLTDLDGRPLYRHALDAVVAAAIGPVVVVTGAVPLDLPADVTECHNPDWAQGQAGSLRLGIATAAHLGAEAVVVGLADQPGVGADAWRTVAAAAATAAIVVATYPDGTGPNPVRLDRRVWPLLPSEGDEGARSIIRAHPSWVVVVECVGSGADIDTAEDLSRWKSC